LGGRAGRRAGRADDSARRGKLDLEARQPSAPAEALGFEALVYARSFGVPSSVDASKVSAELEQGVLKLHLPKSEAAKPRRIAVRSD
jgi:HSP20 family molecular chaperone IbpA